MPTCNYISRSLLTFVLILSNIMFGEIILSLLQSTYLTFVSLRSLLCHGRRWNLNPTWIHRWWNIFYNVLLTTDVLVTICFGILSKFYEKIIFSQTRLLGFFRLNYRCSFVTLLSVLAKNVFIFISDTMDLGQLYKTDSLFWNRLIQAIKKGSL